MVRTIAAAVAVAGLMASAAPALAEDLQFRVINDSSLDVEYFYATPANRSDWGDDLLGDGRLHAYSYGTATIADGSDQCIYDFRYVMSDGQAYTEEAINLCKLGTYTIHE